MTEELDLHRLAALAAWIRRTHRIVAISLVGGLVACGSPSPTVDPTPTPARASVGPADAAAADGVVDALLGTMAQPDLTYRVTSELHVQTEPGGSTISVMGRYDVRGHDYAGRVHLNGIPIGPAFGADVQLAVLGDAAHLKGFSGGAATVDAPPSLRRPDALQALQAEDLAFLGRTEDGLFEFRVLPWLGGDPLGEWIDLADMGDNESLRTQMSQHDTRLFVDESGGPKRLATSWSFDVAGGELSGRGTIEDEFDAFGLYVQLAEPGGGLFITSYDVIVGVGADHVARTEAWVEVLPPPGETATLAIAFDYPQRPVMFGIEGAIGFVRSHAADGEIVLDRIVEMNQDEIDIPIGEQTVIVYYRTCDGSCSLLDPPSELCSVGLEAEAGQRFQVDVLVRDGGIATCELTSGNGA